MVTREDAKSLLQSTHNLRTHWSGIIIALNALFIPATIGIWIFSIGQHFNENSSPKPLFLIIAIVSSSILLVFWRYYVHYMDNKIAELYPEMIYYENILSVSPKYGTLGYLAREVVGLKEELKNLTQEQKEQKISELVKKQSIGRRGHKIFDMIVYFYIVIMILLSLYYIHNYKIYGLDRYTISLIGGFLVVAIMNLYMKNKTYQWNPNEKHKHRMWKYLKW